MNTIASRLKAIAVTALAFAAGAFAMLGLVWVLGTYLPGGLGRAALDNYGPHGSIAALTDLRALSALTAAFLVITGLVLVIDSAYCDRMIGVFSDVLLMVMAAIAGFVAGYWLLLRLADYANFIGIGFVRAAIVCPLIVFGVSLLPLGRIRGNWPMRIALILILLASGPVLLVLTD